MADAQISHVPDLALADHIFAFRQHSSDQVRAQAKSALLEAIDKNSLSALYLYLKGDLGSEYSEEYYQKLYKINEQELESLDAKIKDAEENLGEVEISQSNVAKAEYLAKICDMVMNFNCRLGKSCL